MPQKIVFVAGLDYPKDKAGKSTGYITKEAQADYLKKGFPTAEVTTFAYGAANASVKAAVGTDPNTILVLFSAGCAKASEMAKYFINKQLRTANIHLNEPYTCDAGVLKTIKSAIGSGVPAANVYSGGTKCTGSNVTGGTVLTGRTGHNQSLEPLGKLLMEKYPEKPAEKTEEKKQEENKTIENPTDLKQEVKTDATSDTNTDKDVAKLKNEEENKVEQEKQVLEDGFEIANGVYTLELSDEESMMVIGPNGLTVTWPDGQTTTIGMLYRTGMPDLTPKNAVQQTKDNPEIDNTSSTENPYTGSSEGDKKEEDKIKEMPVKEEEVDEYVLAIFMPQSDNDRKIHGTITFKKMGPNLSAVGFLTGFPDGDSITREGEESFASQKKELADEMKMILENVIRSKYAVEVKLTYTNVGP